MVITLLIKGIFYTLCAFLIVFIAYSAIMLNSKNVRVSTTLPHPYKEIYAKVKKIPVANLELERYENSLALIKGSRELGKLTVSIYCGILPALDLLLIFLTFNYVNVWYYAVLISFFGTIIPYLEFTNRISKKARILRTANLRYCEAAERYFSSGSHTNVTFEQLAFTSSGALRKVYLTFTKDYLSSPAQAYDNYVSTINDKYAKAFMEAVQKYDTVGTSPCDTIQAFVKTGKMHYSLVESTCSTMSGAKTLGIICFVGSIVMGYMCDNMSTTLGQTPSNQWLTYVMMGVALLVITASSIYDKNSEG